MPIVVNYPFKNHLRPDPLCQLLLSGCRHRSTELEKAGLGQRFGRRGVAWDMIQRSGPSDAHRDKEPTLITLKKNRHVVMCMETAGMVYSNLYKLKAFKKLSNELEECEYEGRLVVVDNLMKLWVVGKN